MVFVAFELFEAEGLDGTVLVRDVSLMDSDGGKLLSLEATVKVGGAIDGGDIDIEVATFSMFCDAAFPGGVSDSALDMTSSTIVFFFVVLHPFLTEES